MTRILHSTTLLLTLLGLGVLCATEASAQAMDEAPPRTDWGHWGYEAEDGPATWGGTCAEGEQQSPIALRSSDGGADAEEVSLRYRRTRVELVDNGHTILVPTAGDLHANLDGARYFLFQLHFHAPSEHTLDGREWPMEIHLVHRTPEQRLLVVAIPVVVGETNAALAELLADVPPEGRRRRNLRFDPGALLPASRAAVRYRGSLTTPPCSEGVEWAVLRTPITISAAQLAAFEARYSGNRRPTQPEHARTPRPARLPDAR